MKGFARVAEPLHSLTRKDVIFEWTSGCWDSFNMLRKALIEAPVLISQKASSYRQMHV